MVKITRITGQNGSIRYIFIILYDIFVEIIVSFFLRIIPSTGHVISYIIVFMTYIFGYIICIYFLIGSKIIYVIRNPLESEIYGDGIINDSRRFLPRHDKNDDEDILIKKESKFFQYN